MFFPAPSHRKPGVFFLVALLVLLFAPAVARPQTTAPAKTVAPIAASATHTYYTVHLQGSRIGSLVLARDDHAAYEGKPAIRADSTMTLSLPVLGAPAKIVTITRTWSEPKTGRPLAQQTRTESAARISDVTATYTQTSVTYRANIQGETQTGTLILAPGERFLVDPSDGAGASAVTPKVGLKLTGKIFVSDMLRLVNAEIQVVGQERIVLGGSTAPAEAFKMVSRSELGSTILYLAGNGDLLRYDGPLKMRIEKASKQAALEPIAPATKPMDLALAIAVTPTGKKIPEIGVLRSARYEIHGITRNFPPSDTIQSVEYLPESAADKGRRVARVGVTARPLPSTAPDAHAFARPEDAPATLRPYLASTLYVPATDPEFKALAAQVIQNEQDIARASAKIAEYVHTTIRPDASIAALRTARDIRRDPRGVCRDYTTLFATLARAAGIPTRQCVGMAYLDGKFLFHAWPEVWVGGDTWIALEPTWGEPFADATHIKLAQGEITEAYSLAADIGNYRIEVLEAQQ